MFVEVGIVLSPRMSFRAAWVVPITGPAIHHALLTVEAGRVVEVGPAGPPDRTAIDLGDVVVLPGLINAHTHLELSHFSSAVPAGPTFSDWIRRLVVANPACRDTEPRRLTLEVGIHQSIAGGTTALADIGYGPWSLQAWAKASIRIAGFLEVLGIGPKRFADHPQSLDRQAGAIISHSFSDRWYGRIGLSPHAPYSVDGAVYRQAAERARRHGWRLTTHLAESPDEVELLRSGTGPLRTLLEDWNLWDGSFVVPGCSPVRYLEGLGVLDEQMLLAHVNFADDADLAILAGCGAHVAYCPRSHAHFGHPPHRFRAMLAAGVNVCLGTDSRASNTSLSMLDELRWLWRHEPGCDPAMLLAMATEHGARALGVHDALGGLAPGRWADFITVPMDHPGATDPLRDVLDSAQPVTAAYIAGRVVRSGSTS